MHNATRPRRPAASGLTLLEVIVVIIIIGILLGLLIPAINLIRDRTSRRNQCSIQLANLAGAAIQQELAKLAYPGWTQNYGWFTGTQGDPNTPQSDPSAFPFHQKVSGWAVALLPHLDAQATYEIWAHNSYPVIHQAEYTEHAAPSLGVLQCPNDPTARGVRGRNSYVSNNGMHHRLPGGVIPRPLAVDGGDELAAFARSMRPANGVFNNKFSGGEIPTGVAVRATDLHDGLAYTVLFSENLQASPWHLIRSDEQASAALLATAAPAAVDQSPSSPQSDIVYPLGEPRFLQGFVWHWEDDNREVQLATGCPPVSPVHRINGRPEGAADVQGIFDIQMSKLPIAQLPDVARPSSAHAGGVYMSFADGSTQFVTESVDYRIYQAHMTAHGQQSDVPTIQAAPPSGEP